MTLLAVQGSQIVQVLWVSFASVIGITAVFSFVVLASARSAEARRDGRGGAATVYVGLAAVGAIVVAVAVVVGVKIMLAK